MTGPPGRRIFHLVEAGDAPVAGQGAVGVEGLQRHGFVHCCHREQIAEVADWWFGPTPGLMALELDPALLRDPLRFEPSPRRPYPHLYGPIPTGALVASHALVRSTAGGWGLPPALTSPPPGFAVEGRSGSTVVRARWRSGGLEGDEAWVGAAERAVASGQPVATGPDREAPASLATAFEAFCLLDGLVEELLAYHGDGFEGG